MHPHEPNPAQPPVPLGYDSRVHPPVAPIDLNPTPIRWGRMIVNTVSGLPGIVLLGALLLMIPSLLYAVIDPWFGGGSVAAAVDTAVKAGIWASTALILILLLRRCRNRNRRRPISGVTEPVEN